MANQVLQIVVMHKWFKSELVLERDRKSGNQVEAVDFGEKILLAELRVLAVPFINMDPDEASKILRCKLKLSPVFAAVVVALVGRGTSEAQCETDDETKNGKQELIDTDWRMVSTALRSNRASVRAYGRVRILISA